MINDMNLKMLHHIRRRTGVAASLESGSGYMSFLLGLVIPFLFHLHVISGYMY